MAKINLPRQTVFPMPEVVRLTTPTGTAGLEARLEAEEISRNVANIQRGVNFANDLFELGANIDQLRNRKAAGDFEIAKANAENRWLTEESRAMSPEPLEVVEGARQELIGSPFRRQSDAELYEERYPQFLEDVEDITKQLKGRAKKAFQVWVATQEPGWRRVLTGHYAERQRSATEADMRYSIEAAKAQGNATAIVELYQVGANTGTWSMADEKLNMRADVIEAMTNAVQTYAVGVANVQGYEAAYAELRGIEIDDVQNILGPKDIEDVRRVVRTNLSDRYEEDEREYKLLKTQIEGGIENQITSFLLDATLPDGTLATSQSVLDAIEGSQLRGSDQYTWIARLNTAVEAKKRAPSESDQATYLRAVTMARDPSVTLPQLEAQLMEWSIAGLLSIDHNRSIYKDAWEASTDPYWNSVKVMGHDLVKAEVVDPAKAANVEDRLKLWADTPEGREAMAKNPDALLEKARIEYGEETVKEIYEDNEGKRKIPKGEVRLILQTQEIIREAGVAIEEIPTKNVSITLTGMPGPDNFTIYDISKSEDHLPMAQRILDETGMLVKGWAENAVDKSIAGYVVKDIETGYYDLFRLGEKDKLEFYDVDDGKWKKFGEGRYRRR